MHPRRERIDWFATTGFAAFHVVALVGALRLGCTATDVALFATSYVVRMFGVAAGFHRYFSHRSFSTSRGVQLALALVATTSTQQGPLWWASHHRAHHAASDTELDVHSSRQRGFFWAHVGWLCVRAYNETDWRRVKDFARFPELVALNRLHLVPSIALAVVLLASGGPHALVWGYFVPTCALWHATFSLNSVCHAFGTRRFATHDDSRNNPIVALLTLGEGWHNNHHHRPRAARHGVAWWEIDATHLALRALAALGVVRDLADPRSQVGQRHRHAAVVRGHGEQRGHRSLVASVDERLRERDEVEASTIGAMEDLAADREVARLALE